MAKIDEVLAAMPDTAAEAAIEYLTIDPVTRKITVPAASRIFGVTSDEVAERKYFLCPRYVGDGLDLAGMFLTVYFRTATGYEDGYLVDDVTVSGEYVTFSWLLAESVTMHKGAVQFSVCADLPNTAEKRRPDWNTTIATGEVLEGLDPDVGDVAGETSDVVAQLREMVTAQTGAVEATGATQVQEVHAAATAATAEAQAQIEAKGVATLATIPADYTTLAGKVNEQANAIKGHLSGEIVQAGDVSPVEHFLGVKVQGKNLFDISKIPTMETDSKYAYIGEVGANYLTITTPDGYDGNGYCTVALPLKEVCPSLEVGKTYILTATTESNSTNMYLPGIKKSWIFGAPMVATDEMLKSTFTFYGLSTLAGMGTGDCTISNIQIEEGTEATEYAPYIDPAGVTVTRCGKNLWPVFVTDQTYPNGSYTRVNDDGSFLLHVAGDNIRFDYMINLPAGSYTMSNGEHTTTDKKPYIILYETDGATHYCHETFTLEKPTACKLTVYAWHEYTGDFVFTPQLEKAPTATEYEPYTGATAMPDESGTVTGLPSAAPTMTLLTDTAGVAIDCTYNRDSNAVYAELLAKIAALGGTI